jgi:hypothetical protein
MAVTQLDTKYCVDELEMNLIKEQIKVSKLIKEQVKVS